MSDKSKWVDLFGTDLDYNKEALEAECAKLFEVFKAGWDATEKAIRFERDNPSRGWNAPREGLSDTSRNILDGMREGLTTACNVVNRPMEYQGGRDALQEAFDAWLQEQVDEVDTTWLDGRAGDAENEPPRDSTRLT